MITSIHNTRVKAARKLAERKERWHAMMARLLEHDIHAWRRGYLSALQAA